MDYEREPDSAVGDPPNESEASVTTDDAATAARESEQGSTTEAEDVTAATDTSHYDSHDLASDIGFGTDADVMDDAFASGPNPPEWPAADLAPDDSSAPTTPDMTSDAAAHTSDVGDDSDAPIVADAAPVANAAVESHIRAENVNLSQGGVQSIEASTVTLSQGGAGQVRADEMTVEQGGVGLAHVKTLKLGDGASAFAVLADEATVEEGSNAFLVVSRTVNGEVRSAVDWRAALAFGAGLGLALSILRRLR